MSEPISIELKDGRTLTFRRPKLSEFDIEDFDAGIFLFTEAQRRLQESMANGDAKGERKAHLDAIRHMRGCVDLAMAAMTATATNGTSVEIIAPEDELFLLSAFTVSMDYRNKVAPDTSTVKNLLGPSWRQAGAKSKDNADGS